MFSVVADKVESWGWSCGEDGDTHSLDEPQLVSVEFTRDNVFVVEVFPCRGMSYLRLVRWDST